MNEFAAAAGHSHGKMNNYYTYGISLILVNEFYQIFCRFVLFLIINDVIPRDLTITIMELTITSRIESYWQFQSRLHASEATHLNFCRILLHTNMKLQVLITNNSAQAFLCEHAVAQISQLTFIL